MSTCKPSVTAADRRPRYAELVHPGVLLGTTVAATAQDPKVPAFRADRPIRNTPATRPPVNAGPLLDTTAAVAALTPKFPPYVGDSPATDPSTAVPLQPRHHRDLPNTTSAMAAMNPKLPPYKG